MNKLLLEFIFQIAGLTAASGIHYQNDTLYIVSDESDFLYEYHTTNEVLNKIALVDSAQEKNSKKNKLDFEAIAQKDDKLYIFGSGSKPKREIANEFSLNTNESKQLSLDILYPSIASFAELSEGELNIEGAIFKDNELLLFNRGNGKQNKNFIVTIQGKDFTEEFNLFIKEYNLPKLNGVNTGFSDAVLVDDKIYFLATAEKSNSTYADGKITGTLFGCIDTKKLKLKYTKVLSNNKKLEGITVYKKDKKNITFLLCEDNDDGNQTTSNIYKLEIKR